MNKKTLLLLMALGTTTLYAQESKEKNQQTNQVKTIPTQESSAHAHEVEQKTQKVSIGEPRAKQTPEQRIQAIDAHISAIQIKMNHVRLDEKLTQKAEQEGWFKEMERIKAELTVERNLLVNQSNKTSN